MKTCFELLRDVLMDAFEVSTLHFMPPYENISQIDQGLRAAVWTNYTDRNTKIQLSSIAEKQNRLLIIRSNLGFFNVMIFWEGNDSKEFISIGPFRNDELSPNYFTQILKDAHISPAKISQIKTIYETMPFAQVDSVVNVCKHILGIYISEFKDIVPELIEYTEQQRPVEVYPDVIQQNFLNFSEEYQEMLSTFLKYLKCGDNVRAKKALQLLIHSSKLSSNRTLRNYKALLTALNNYCNLALLETSIHPSYILRQAATIGIRIEETTSLGKLEQMPNDICHKYCLLVKNYANSEFSKLTKDVIAYIEMHLEEELSLNQLATHFNKNTSYLSNVFSKETGQPLTKFIQKTRIQEAVRLLNTSNMSISEVALAVGYQDFSYFSKVFSKIVGTSPREYKSQRR